MPVNSNSQLDQLASNSSIRGSWQKEEHDLELRDILRTLKRRKYIVAVALAIGLALAVLYVSFSQKKYSSTATIELNKQSGNDLGLADLTGGMQGIEGGTEMTADLLTEQAVITSDNTALGVIERLKLYKVPPYAIPPALKGQTTPLQTEQGLPLDEAPLERERILGIFRSRLNVQIVKGTRLLNVTYTDTDPNRSAAIANAVIEVYTDEYTQARYDATSKASSWLSDQLADLKAKVQDSQAKVAEYQRESGLAGMTLSPGAAGNPQSSGSVTASDSVPMERLVELNRELTNAEVSRIAKQAIYKMTQTQDPEVVIGIGSSSLVSTFGAGSVVSPDSAEMSLLQQLRQQQAQLKIELAEAKTNYGQKNPLILQLQNKENELNQQISLELSRIRARAKNDLDLATLAEQGIQKKVADQTQEVNEVNRKADQLVLLQEEALSSRSLYQDLYSKLEEASVTAGIRASNITLVNPARSPVQPSFPRTKRTLALGGVMGLLFGVIGAFSWDYFDDSLTAPEELEHITAIPAIAAIPDFTKKGSTISRYGLVAKSQKPEVTTLDAWVVRAPNSRIAEAYRTFRTALMLSQAERPPKTVLLTSSSPEDGKSTTCFNIAAAFAIQGDRVLCLDADLRRPSAHRLFDCANDAGLSNCLSGGMDYRSALKASPGIDTLFLLPAGPPPPNPSELIGSTRFADLLNELEKDFDYIFIDSPPALVVTDAQLIASKADGYIIVLRSGKTTKRILQRALALVRTSKAKALGIVVNAVDGDSAAGYGYGYYGKGGGYYVEDQN